MAFKRVWINGFFGKFEDREIENLSGICKSGSGRKSGIRNLETGIQKPKLRLDILIRLSQ
jgi:hypothetical protein